MPAFLFQGMAALRLRGLAVSTPAAARA